MKMITYACFFLLFSCSSSQKEKKFQDLTETGQCQEAARNMPDFKLKKASANAKAYTGKTASYILTGAAYGVDMIYYLTGGLIVPVVICSPLILLQSASSGTASSNPAGHCVGSVGREAFEIMGKNKTLGSKTYKGTKKWRCPDLNFAVKNVLKISSCYESKGDTPKAIEQLNILKDENAFGGCIDSEKKELINRELKRLHGA
jgi:hypothetical protein